MRTFLLIMLQAVVSACLFPTAVLHAQAPPSDFKFSATVGGSGPWSEMARITIDNAGQAKYVRFKTGGAPAVLAETTFTVSAPDLQQLWKMIQDSSFFSLAPSWTDTSVHDGMFARMVVTANGTTHDVRIKNVAQPTIQGMLDLLNALVPDTLRLQYSPPQKFDFTPKDPCSYSFGALGNRPNIESLLLNSRDPKTRALPGPRRATISRVPPVELSHAGVTVAYDVSLQDAVKHGWANLSSKGDFFGDDVAITIDDQNVPPPSNTINITLYLEFWGSLATEDNVNAICGDIAKKWDGATTSSGQKIQVGFVTRTAVNANAPPNTPGFDDIQLVGKGFRSYVTGSDFGVNYGTGSGVWEVGGDPGEYAHEAGHLMGLPDRYDDYNKQSDGSWVDSKTSKTFANDDDFADYIHSKYPNGDLNAVKDALKNTDTYSVAWDGHENDLMGDLNGSLLQSDIDQIAGHPGLLVHVPEGTVFADRADDQQNLIVIHSDDIFAGPGQKRRLNGIYAACIDHFKSIPDSLGVFDVAPPVDQWTGIQAATYMAMLLHYVDSAGLYCPLDFATQEAIWRLSDNASSVFGNSVDQLLADAGFSVGDQILDFPRLSGGSALDSASHLLIPNQLYVASIRPAFATGQTGTANSLTASLLHPLGTPPPAGFSWTAIGPDGAPASIAGTDSTVSLTPGRSGIYEVALKVSLNDSLNGQRTFTSEHKSYVIVPDAYTETFEHAGLTDRFPWKSYGDVPWTISNTNAETGNYSATPGPVTSGQSSTLGIEVSLPADSVIIFSVRSFTQSLFDAVLFSVDSLPMAFLGGASDWTIQKYPLSAGRHLLTWTYNSASSTPGANLWLDNIFFPGNVVVTSVADVRADVPTVFALAQNYPNPFNPTTVFRYQVPVVSNVRLVIYDVLGREVATLVNERKVPGRYEVTFDGSGLASGVYFSRMTAGDFVQTRKLTLIK